MDMFDIQQVLAEATQHFDRLAARLWEDHGIEHSPYYVMGQKLREARQSLTEMEPRFRITEAGRAMLKGGE